MTTNNPFSHSNYDLGIGDEYGISTDSATENILRTAYQNTTSCYVCTAPNPQYRIVAKKDKYNNAELQKGLFICTHCLQLKPIDSKMYGIKELQ